MIRRDFLRNSLMALAVSLVPKILQPIDPIDEAVGSFTYNNEDVLMKNYRVVLNGDFYWYTDEFLKVMNDFERRQMGGYKLYKTYNDQI